MVLLLLRMSSLSQLQLHVGTGEKPPTRMSLEDRKEEEGGAGGRGSPDPHHRRRDSGSSRTPGVENGPPDGGPPEPAPPRRAHLPVTAVTKGGGGGGTRAPRAGRGARSPSAQREGAPCGAPTGPSPRGGQAPGRAAEGAGPVADAAAHDGGPGEEGPAGPRGGWAPRQGRSWSRSRSREGPGVRGASEAAALPEPGRDERQRHQADPARVVPLQDHWLPARGPAELLQQLERRDGLLRPGARLLPRGLRLPGPAARHPPQEPRGRLRRRREAGRL
ncbi:translation initiation factor IF-2 isoform X2 [Anolis carolinensis]|uniref:translation initiation factor IF-2 isoform X2 n=1 Tax=Anolis carolinensis TaxID=28377 RepID=UPI002F2B8EB3